MQSALPPSLQKNIVGRGRPLSYVYTCADFVHVKCVFSNLSSGCYKNISQIKKKRRTPFNSECMSLSPFVPSISPANRLFLHGSETLRDIYLSTWLFNPDVCPRITSFPPQVIRLTHTPVLFCTSLLHRIKSSLGSVAQANRSSSKRSSPRMPERATRAYRSGNNSYLRE